MRSVGARAGLDRKVLTDVRVALFELVVGHVDALAYPRPIILKLAREAGILNRIRPVGEPLVEVKRGIAVRLGATGLRDRLSRAVKEFVTTPEYHRIYVKLYGKAKPFWTARRMGWTMGGVIVTLLLIMAVWRHVSLLRVNRKLVANISQRIDAQNELEESEERYRSLAEFIPEAVLVTDHGTIRFCNPAAIRLFGAENAAQLIGLDQSKLVHAEDRPRLRARCRR